MSGHSKWSQIKRKKGITDVKRGQLFTKLARELTSASRENGPDPAGNIRLRLAIQRARDNNMPMDNIERAVKRGSGEGQSQDAYFEVTYEGYSAGGAAVLVEAMTDNRNRAVSDIRRVFSRNGGNMGETGCVAWQFESKGVITGGAPDGKAEEVALAAIDAGADDVKTDDDGFEVYTAPEGLEAVRQALESFGANIVSSELQMVAKSTTSLDPGAAHQTLRLLDLLEELDDVQKVHTNAEFPDEVLAEAAS